MAKYKMIDITQMDRSLIPYVEATVRSTISPDKVLAIAGNNEWSFKAMHVLGEKRAVVMCFRGMEVAVFFKRHLINVESDDIDPLPEVRMDDPDKAWIRIELFHVKSVKNRGTWITSELDYLRDETKTQKGLLKAQEVELEVLRAAAAKKERKANAAPPKTPVKKQYLHHHPPTQWKRTAKARRKKQPRKRKAK